MDTSSQKWEPIVFKGTGGEYFGIAITNVILTILTLGIYSAWAKVKTATYFANKTIIDETPLAYHATGKQILIGRLIALLILAVISAAYIFLDALGASLGTVILTLIIVFLTPIIFNRSINFNLKMHSFRNVRFSFSGNYWKTFFYTIISPLLIILSLFLAAPYLTAKSNTYFMSGISFGSKKLSTSLSATAFYKPFFIILLLPIFVLLSLGLIAGFFLGGVAALPILFLYLYLIYGPIVYYVATKNLLTSTLAFEEMAHFQSSLNAWSLIGIMVSNYLAVIFSFGLLFPWATIRFKKYMLENHHYQLIGDLDSVIDAETKKSNAIAEGMSDLDSDFSLDLPI